MKRESREDSPAVLVRAWAERLDLHCLPVLLSVAAVVFVLVAFTGQWPWKGNGYNSYTLQACSWLKGRLDLGQNYEWLELAVYGGKYYVSFPPFPSYVMLPFAAVFGEHTPDHWIALAVLLLGVFYAVRLCEEVQHSRSSVAFFTLFLYLASGLLFVSINGYVWFIAQNMCFTLSVMSLYYAVKGKGGMSLTLWACAVGCRPMAAMYVLLLLYILWEKEKMPWHTYFLKKWHWAAGPVLLALSYMLLNYFRFGSIVEFGHNYLPEFTRTETGQFDLSYVKANISQLFALPQSQGEGMPLKFSTANGMAFWLVTPLFITALAAWLYCFVKKRKGEIATLVLIPVLTVFYVFILCCHRTLGGWHFGNRYLLDTLPWLFYGLMRWKPEGKWFVRWNLPLFFLGFALNLTGTAATYNYWI